MKYGVISPGGAAPEQLELAVMAAQAGWDGVLSGRQRSASMLGRQRVAAGPPSVPG